MDESLELINYAGRKLIANKMLDVMSGSFSLEKDDKDILTLLSMFSVHRLLPS
jgi:hypothetical protein